MQGGVKILSYRPVALFAGVLLLLRLLDLPIWASTPLGLGAAFLVLDKRVARQVLIVGLPFISLALIYENAPLDGAQRQLVLNLFFAGLPLLVLIGLALQWQGLREVRHSLREIRELHDRASSSNSPSSQ